MALVDARPRDGRLTNQDVTGGRTVRMNRRQFLKYGSGASAGLYVSTRFGWVSTALAEPRRAPLSDPAMQPKFAQVVPNALDPAFRYVAEADGYHVGVGVGTHYTGLVNRGRAPVPTTIFGYGQGGAYTWPGKTFEVQRGQSETVVHWDNELFGVSEHLLPVDTSVHWAYSLPGYEGYSIQANGIPIAVHLHGGHTDYQFDGNPEFFFSPGGAIVGPQWDDVPGWFTNEFRYDDDVPAGTLWYHDHALGMTRLNVYAGMAGFYIVRDAFDTGAGDNPLGLPAFPYEMALAIQDRMFRKGGQLFYPALPPDPAWGDFITGEGLGNGDVPNPSVLAEFFGDHMVVNGKIWPKADVEPRQYRLRLLNGCDSRFLVLRFRVAVSSTSTDLAGSSWPLSFHVIGTDQGLASVATETDTLVIEPGGRYDIVVDFGDFEGDRVIMENIGGDAPFGGGYGGDLSPDDVFPDRQTDRIMAFDVQGAPVSPTFDPVTFGGGYGGNTGTTVRTRKVALFEGTDGYGRLMPLLGTAETAEDAAGNSVAGALGWSAPATERPVVGDTEVWEIHNATMDAHPVHLHLVSFEVLGRREFTADLVAQEVHQHDGSVAQGFRLENIVLGDPVVLPTSYVDNGPRDVVTALPGQVTTIKATFDKPGRYVWHCHILSHEDHEMMRVLDVVPPT